MRQSQATVVLVQGLKAGEEERRFRSQEAGMTGVPGSRPQYSGAKLPGFVLWFLFLVVCILGGLPVFADQVDIWMQTPDNWEDRRSELGRDLMKQLFAPGGVAVKIGRAHV